MQPLVASASRASDVVKQAKQSVVSIDYKPILTAYSIPLEGGATGVVVDKQEGYLLTNGMIGEPTIAEYTVSFFNGTKAKAKICYSDPWLNFSILKLDPAIIPTEALAVKISEQEPIEGEAIFTITIPEEKRTQRILSKGRVSDINFVKVVRMPEHLIDISMDTNDGGVGSLVFNQKGEGIALINFKRQRTLHW
ncbi:S1 family peptidase [Cardinium endosymbiont of Nabis limbatus]|uniref:S1 family peptidase n=1 Tax=Cardinium endosymbiont of Nabis limbatus TaxID=3066217 RepID=UPI003AF36FD3